MKRREFIKGMGAVAVVGVAGKAAIKPGEDGKAFSGGARGVWHLDRAVNQDEADSIMAGMSHEPVDHPWGYEVQYDGFKLEILPNGTGKFVYD